MSTETAKRACQGTSKKGTPCRAFPLKDGDFCLAHADAETRASVGFVAEAGRLGGRPPKPRAVDVLKERLEGNIDRVLAPLFEALEATRSVVVGNGPSAHVEEVEDIPTRIAAARELLDRAYGKSRSSSDITLTSRDEWMERLAAMEAEFVDLDNQLQAESTGNA